MHLIPHPALDNVALTSVPKVKSMGVILDNILMEAQVTNVVRLTFPHILQVPFFSLPG